MLAWSCAVLVGDEPTVAFEYQAPCGIMFLSTGQELGHRFSTSMPPASHTRVTISFGGVWRCDSGRSASDIGRPSSDWKGKCRSDAWVSAMSASVTGRFTLTPGLM